MINKNYWILLLYELLRKKCKQICLICCKTISEHLEHKIFSVYFFLHNITEFKMAGTKLKVHHYYIRNSEVPFEEDMFNEFKGHRNLAVEELPPWTQESTKEKASRRAVSRFVFCIGYQNFKILLDKFISLHFACFVHTIFFHVIILEISLWRPIFYGGRHTCIFFLDIIHFSALSHFII